MKQRLAMAVFTATLCLSATGQAKEIPFGEDFGGWKFTQEEDHGFVNCRAHYDNSGSGHFIMAMRTNGDGYVSINTPKGLSGTYPDGKLIFGSGEMDVEAKVYGPRLLFTHMTEQDLSDLMGDEGRFTWVIPSRNLSGKVDVGGDIVGEALARVSVCVEENK